jgi:hypothetical protein
MHLWMAHSDAIDMNATKEVNTNMISRFYTWYSRLTLVYPFKTK